MITGRDLKGIIPPVVTPITPDVEVDVPALRRVVEYQLDGGVSGIFACGSSGEFPCMTFEDRRVVIRTVVEAVKRRVPVLVGCAATGIREIVQHARIAKALGADAIVVTPPYYFFYTPSEIVAFYTAIAKAVPIPIVAYNIPGTTHVSLSVGAVLQISKIKGVIGIKDSSGEVGPMTELLKELEDNNDFAVFQGHERVAAVSLLLGADGCVLGLANAAPKLCVELFDAAKAGKVQRALQLQDKMNDLFNLFRVMDPSFSSVSTVIAGMKGPLEILGLCSRRPFPPALPATPQHLKKMKEIMRGCGVKV